MIRRALALLVNASLLISTLAAGAQECIPRGAAVVIPVQASATGTTGAITATLPASTIGKSTFICGFSITSGGATTASIRAATLTGPTTTLNYSYVDPAAVQGNLDRRFVPCLISAAPNTAITVTVPGTGTGTVAIAVNMWGCYQ